MITIWKALGVKNQTEAMGRLRELLSPPSTPVTEELEEALRLAEIGEYLYSERAYSYGDGQTEPREYGIEWQWQQHAPGEFGQGVLLAEAAKWHQEMADEGYLTEAARLRAALSSRVVEAQAVPVRYLYDFVDVMTGDVTEEVSKVDRSGEPRVSNVRPLYAHPAPADAVEPVKTDDGLAKAIAFVRKRLDDYVAEQGGGMSPLFLLSIAFFGVSIGILSLNHTLGQLQQRVTNLESRASKLEKD